MVMATLEQQSTTCGNAGLAWTFVITKVGGMFPDDRESMKETFGLKTMKNETAVAFTGRPRLVLDRLQTEGNYLPSEARRYIFVAWMPTREFGSKQRSCL